MLPTTIVTLALAGAAFAFLVALPFGVKCLALYRLHDIRDRLYGLRRREPEVAGTRYYRLAETYVALEIMAVRDAPLMIPLFRLPLALLRPPPPASSAEGEGSTSGVEAMMAFFAAHRVARVHTVAGHPLTFVLAAVTVPLWLPVRCFHKIRQMTSSAQTDDLGKYTEQTKVLLRRAVAA